MPGIKKTMHEYKHGSLHSGSKHGPIVHSRKQAVAIGLAQERKMHHKQNSSRHAKMGVSGSIKVPHSSVTGCASHY